MLGLILLACTASDPASPAGGADTSGDGGVETPVAPVTVPLDDVDLLRRLSLDLAGVPPDLDQLARVQDDPAALDQVRDELLASDRWRARFADLLAEQFLTRVDVFNGTIGMYGLDDADEYPFEHAVGSEPLLLMAAIATEDRPWTDAVTVDWTVADPLLLELWPLEALSLEDAGLTAAPADGWVPARYTDGRPPGGVLMTNGLWWRYWSAPNNYNRGRAAALSRLFLCNDFLLRPISFASSSLLETDSLLEATQTETACVGCHNSLDPLAAAFFGFWWFDIYAEPELTNYHPEREWLGETYLGTEPEYFGTPLHGPVMLGQTVAEDPRFVRCAVQRVASGLLQRTLDEDDNTTIVDLQQDFEDADLRIAALVRAVVQTDEYRAGGLLDEADAAVAEQVQTRRLLSPQQLADSVEALTGFHWETQGFDQLRNDDLGFRILAGGVDGIAVSEPQRDPSVSRLLVIKRLAEAAGSFVAAEDLPLPADQRRLLHLVDDDTTSSDPAFAQQLTDLHLRLHGRAPSDQAIAEEAALFDDVAAADGVEAAWAAVVTLLLRDPAFWTY